MDEKLMTLSDVAEHFIRVSSIDGVLSQAELSLLQDFRDAEQKCRTDAISALSSIRVCLEKALKDSAIKNGISLKWEDDDSEKNLFNIECEIINNSSNANWFKKEIDKIRTRSNGKLHFSPYDSNTSDQSTLPKLVNYDYACPESLCFLFTVLYHLYTETFYYWKNKKIDKNKLITEFSRKVVSSCDDISQNIDYEIKYQKKRHPELSSSEVFYSVWRDQVNLSEGMLRKLPIDKNLILEEYSVKEQDDTYKEFCYRTCKKTSGGILTYSYIFLLNKGKEAVYHRAEVTESVRQNNDENVPSIINASFINTTNANSYDVLVYRVQKGTELLSAFRREHSKISKSEAVSIVSQIVEGLYMCRNDFHHRNITPSKIFITPKKDNSGFDAKLAGFTYAKVNQINSTVSPQILEHLKKNSNGYSWISSHMLQYTYTTMTDSDFERIDVYSLTAVLAFIIDGKSGVKVKDQTNQIDIDSYYRLFGDDGEFFADIIDADNLDDIPDLKSFNELLQSLV